MASVASQLIEEVTALAQSDSLEDAREICADSTYFHNNLPIINVMGVKWGVCEFIHNFWEIIYTHILNRIGSWTES